MSGEFALPFTGTQIFRQPVARWITVATQFQLDLELLQ
jgi:hypothetical protein